MKSILLDMGCIVALLDRSEEHHRACAEAVAALDGPLITCEAVIAESCHILRHLQGAPESVVENIERGVFLVPFFIKDSASQVIKLMKKYRNVPMGFADACLVTLADALGTGRILTLDQDFRIYRWGRNRPFEILVES
ncbi:MAG: PIN domain-containing protein [Planctomycetes bacterium]|nr:PIN domain-containing protein [Planctomycetota bacterium]